MVWVFWIAVAAAVTWFLLTGLAGMFMDTGAGERLFPFAIAAGVVTVLSVAVFVVWYSLHSLGVTVSVGAGG
ncbi:hypothetical protein IU451_28720 [Nocardia cyriacigeorgica]|uniref:hypothetical protein n=1 Tax=Nocardia cyriacigeorgica TaxID=135487 RepID=UPI00189359EE|nr:hypothetical protein [Nocardia cyriacigeorgica]MBF6326486.1 hypothetical protein [Nocardia cyriacigeorgica]